MGVYNKHFKFLQKLQQYIGQSPTIQSQDIEYFLNMGQDLWVDMVYEKFNGKEELRRRLNSIVVVSNISNGSVGTGIYGGEIWELPEDVKYILDEFVRFNNSTENILVKPIGFNNKQANNPFKRPYDRLVWRIEAGYNTVNKVDRVELIKGTTLPITNYIVTYIKVPNRIYLHTNPQEDTDISDYWEDEIVDLAVKIALESYKLTGAFSYRKEEKKSVDDTRSDTDK